MTSYSRYHVALIEESADLPAPWTPPRARRGPDDVPRSLGLRALMEAFAGLDHRSEGPEAWGPSFSTNALAFVLDVMSDPVLVRGADGTVLFRNRAATRLAPPGPPEAAIDEVELEGRRYERRAVVFRESGEITVVEILRRL